MNDTILFLKTVFKNDDKIWIDEHDKPGIPGQNILTRVEWVERFENGGDTFPHIICNPLNGLPAPKKTGDGVTFRGDNNVTQFRFCVVEFDNLSREDQLKFWSAAKLPIVALIDTGGKSIHAWIDVQKLAKVASIEDWQAQIKERLYDRLLIPMGVDGACSNPARLSRLPGHFRQEKGSYQRLLWLSPTGRHISC